MPFDVRRPARVMRHDPDEQPFRADERHGAVNSRRGAISASGTRSIVEIPIEETRS